ncbi:MAG TPA: excisionase family DNA-binding protein [Gemmatimonadales bacterium]|nr:excisionase family DNA-binding protein [Gemmatimonadales bacterium]
MKYLPVGEAAKRLGVSVDVVRSLVESGELRGIRTGGGHRRIRDDDVERRRTTQRATRTKQRVSRSLASERRPAAHATRTPRLVEPNRQRYIEEDQGSFDDFKAEIEREAAKERAAAADAARAAAAEVERKRLEGWKKYGRDLPSCMFVPTEWRARVVEDLEDFVTGKRLPPSLSQWEAQRIVEARVDLILKQCRDAEAQRQQQETEKQRLDALIVRGNDHAKWQTITGWDLSESDRARREVARVLKAKVRADWTDDDVKDLVDQVLARWEDDEGEDQDDEEASDDDYEEDIDSEEDDELDR